uniref:Protein TOC75-3ic-like n=1 Tax=Rhizophora mucronata TaxID=61149 RepID=A0A2P2IU86_RHIMU
MQGQGGHSYLLASLAEEDGDKEEMEEKKELEGLGSEVYGQTTNHRWVGLVWVGRALGGGAGVHPI